MGAQIAAHCANAGLEVMLLDIAPTGLTPQEEKNGLTLASKPVRNRIVKAGLEAAKKIKPAAFFSAKSAGLITIGNFEDDLNQLQTADWIIEAVIEKLSIKRELFAKIDSIRKPDCIISSNTSGIPIKAMAEGMSEGFRAHFLGTHFFNPPRYLRLLEVIPTADTLPEVVSAIADFCDRRLGNVIVFAKDLPNFIANRIATFC